MDIQWNRASYYVIALCFTFFLEASPWKDFNPPASQWLAQRTSLETHKHARYLILDELAMRMDIDDSIVSIGQLKRSLSKRSNISNSSKLISLPLSDGSTLAVNIVPSHILPQTLSEQYPLIKAYRIVPDSIVMNGRLDITPNGFHAMVQLRTGELFFIDPENSSKQRRYVSYRKSDQIQSENDTFSCGVKTKSVTSFQFSPIHVLHEKKIIQPNSSLLIYKIAIAATGEYVVKNGGTVESALASIVTTLNRVNQVFEQDLAIRLSLVENNDQLIYTNASSDPYDGTDSLALLTQNQLNIDRVIGNQNYDIGHLFTTSGGGLAAIASVCNSSKKAKGVSGISNPVNDSFNLDYVAHEIGHQLGATHTFNSQQGLCSGETRQSRTAFEPGSGSTIMSYAGYCGADNLQSNTDAMLHIGSIRQITDYSQNYYGNYCGIRKEIENTAPQVKAGGDYIIPAQTPFTLTGTAEDPDGDALVFSWQQTDSGKQSLVSDDKGDNALFRVYMPSGSLSRTFPPTKDILEHTKTRGEDLPFQQRTLNFSLVAQDSQTSSESDEMTVKVIRTGSRFALNMPRSSYNRGETQKIYWHVANTDKPPIDCTHVNIQLSTDGGYLFDHTLASNIPNTGEAWITIPADSVLTSRGRFKLQCSNNIFFAISYRDFFIKNTADNIQLAYMDEDQPEKNLEDRALDQNGSALIQISSIEGDINASGAGGGSLSYLFLVFLVFPLCRYLRLR